MKVMTVSFDILLSELVNRNDEVFAKLGLSIVSDCNSMRINTFVLLLVILESLKLIHKFDSSGLSLRCAGGSQESVTKFRSAEPVTDSKRSWPEP
jgi:hypothetical protein